MIKALSERDWMPSHIPPGNVGMYVMNLHTQLARKRNLALC